MQLDSVALQRCLEAAEQEVDGEDAAAAGETAAVAVSAPPLLSLFFKDGPRGWAAAAAGSNSRRFSCPTAGIKGLIEQYTAEGRHRKLADFEDHLSDISRWGGERASQLLLSACKAL